MSGFIAEEIRESGRRLGFSLERFGGERGLLAHVDLGGPPRVGRYGVDLATFERLAIPALEQAGEYAVAIIHELGKMELASDAFRKALAALLDRPVPVALAAALAVRGPRVGHVYVDLATIRETAIVDADEVIELGTLAWPPVAEWTQRLAASGLVARGDEDVGPSRPLRLGWHLAVSGPLLARGAPCRRRPAGARRLSARRLIDDVLAAGLVAELKRDVPIVLVCT